MCRRAAAQRELLVRSAWSSRHNTLQSHMRKWLCHFALLCDTHKCLAEVEYLPLLFEFYFVSVEFEWSVSICTRLFWSEMLCFSVTTTDSECRPYHLNAICLCLDYNFDTFICIHFVLNIFIDIIIIIILLPCLKLSIRNTLINEGWSVSRHAPSVFPRPSGSVTQHSGQMGIGNRSSGFIWLFVLQPATQQLFGIFLFPSLCESVILFPKRVRGLGNWWLMAQCRFGLWCPLRPVGTDQSEQTGVLLLLFILWQIAVNGFEGVCRHLLYRSMQKKPQKKAIK